MVLRQTRLWHFVPRTYCKPTFSSLTIVKSNYRVTLTNVGDALLRQVFSQDLIFNAKINTLMDKNKINNWLRPTKPVINNKIVNITKNCSKFNFFRSSLVKVFFIFLFHVPVYVHNRSHVQSSPAKWPSE